MASYPMPSWLRSPSTDLAADYQNGFQMAQRLAQTRQKMAQDAQMAQMDIELKKQQLQEKATQEAQKLEVDRAYNNQMMQLRSRAVAVAERTNLMRTQDAARKLQATQAYEAELEAGTDPEQAILKYGPMMGQHGAVEAAALRAASRRQAQIPASVSQEKMAGEDFLKIQEPSGQIRYQQIHHPKAAAEGTLTPVDRDELRDLERESDKLEAIHEKDLLGQTEAASKNPKVAGKAYNARAQRIKTLKEKIEEIRNRARVTSTKAKPKSKVEMANQLAQEHPDWTRQQIIAEVNASFGK